MSKLLRDLKQQENERREWVAQVSHDLRTPLTALDASLQRALALTESLGNTQGAEAAEIEAAIRVACQDTERVVVLATDLLEVARLDLPDALRLEDVALAEVAERAVTGLAPLAELTGKKIDFQATDTDALVRIDANRLLRVFENLIRNGIEHATAQVRVELTEQEGSVRVTIQDDGPGFGKLSAEVLDTLQARRADSAGLGLTVVARILEAHGVAFSLQNRASGGACVSFEIEKITGTGVNL